MRRRVADRHTRVDGAPRELAQVSCAQENARWTDLAVPDKEFRSRPGVPESREAPFAVRDGDCQDTLGLLARAALAHRVEFESAGAFPIFVISVVAMSVLLTWLTTAQRGACFSWSCCTPRPICRSRRLAVER